MWSNFFPKTGLIMIGLTLIAIAFVCLYQLPSQVEASLSAFFDRLGSIDGATANYYRRIYADRVFLQSAYFFLTGLVCLTVGLRTTRR
jgi:hypothetical protein